MFMRAVILCFSLAILVACKPLSKNDYVKLDTGLSYDKVVAILSEPSECKPINDQKVCYWRDADGAEIQVTFVMGTVVSFNQKGLDR